MVTGGDAFSERLQQAFVFHFFRFFVIDYKVTESLTATLYAFFLIFIKITLMRISKNLIFFILIFLIFQSCKKSPDPVAVRNSVVDSTIVAFTKALYKNQIDSVIAKNKFNGSVAVFQDGIPLYEKQNGFEDFRQKTKLDSNTVFAIGSLSKQFTAVLVLMQMEAGKLQLDDKVSKYLPEFQTKAYENITIKQLLNHSSGIDDFSPNLRFKSGTDFNYSNKGYRSLGKIIEKVSGKTFDQNVTELFQKAGMKHSSTANLFHGKDFGSANTGTSANFSPVENMPKRLAADDISVPAGGLLSTVNDLNQWNSALFGGTILKPETLKLMTSKSSERPHYVLGNVGYGYGIMMNLKAPEAYFHTGYVKGSPSLNIYYPNTKTSVIILSNIANEAIGKEAFFKPHAEIKKTADAVELAVENVRKEMVK